MSATRDPEVTHVKQFAAAIARMAKEIGCDGGKSTGSHSYPSHIEVWVEDDDAAYELVGLEPTHHLGCGCWTGIILRVRRVPDFAATAPHVGAPTPREGV